MKTLIILPTYNEAGNILGIAERVISLGDYVHILIVDDNSADGTREIAGELTKRYKDRVFLLERLGKMGLGSAYVQGFRFALEKVYDYAFEMDADFSHDPREIPNLLEAAALGKPVIVSDIPELHYAVEAGFGLSFKSEDPCDLAKKIEFLLANEGLRKEMGRKAKEYAKDFTWDKIADEYEGFLIETINEK